MDAYLKNYLDERDKKMGIGGDCTFNVYFGKVLVFSIGNLTKIKAQELFDLVDEHNQLNVTLYQATIKIEITHSGEDLDETMLPNVFTRFFKNNP